MNFLLRTASPTPTHPLPPTTTAPEPFLHQGKTLEGLIAEDPPFSASEDGERENGSATGFSVGRHSDVTEEQGWIAIRRNGVPEDWSDALDVRSFRSLDRSFVFPGEQLNILVCLATSEKNAESINPFRVVELMSRNGSLVESTKQQKETAATDPTSTFENVDIDTEHQDITSETIVANGKTETDMEKMNVEENFSATEPLIWMEGHKHQTEVLLERFKNSHFFVRIAESDEPLWSKRSTAEQSDGMSRKSYTDVILNTNIDRGNFHCYSSGGIARNTARCCSLRNGDIVVLLQVNVGIDSYKDPILEVLQFEKSRVRYPSSDYGQSAPAHEDPYGELLRWLFPLDNALTPPPLPPSVGSVAGVGGAYHRPTLSASSSSQLFSFSNFRSYSLPSLPQTTVPSPSVIPPSHSKPRSSRENFDHFSLEKVIKNQDLGIEGYLSFRGVPLEPEQFSVQCGLEGIYFPGNRWRKKLEIIQPIEIHSYAADCNTENLLSVQIKNVSPIHIPDVLLFIDAISIVFEEAPKSGPPLTLPISCIEIGGGHSLPNLALRRGEEHSFILKPSSTFMGRNFKVSGDKSHLQSNVQVGSVAGSNMLKIPKIGGERSAPLNSNTYAVLVSYRCNYTESKLFFKKATSWRPCVARDLMISVASEMSKQTAEPDGKIPQLPFQELTLQASNLTSEDLTLMVLAPASFTAPPSVVSLNSVPTTPVGSLTGIPEFMDRVVDKGEGNLQNNSSMPVPGNEKESINVGKQSFSLSENAASSSDIVPNSDLGCSHLWLQSTVPLGCVPAQSSATVKLELLPLTDGIITLDTLQVAVKEKGMTYIPDHSLKIHATSSIATGIA